MNRWLITGAGLAAQAVQAAPVVTSIPAVRQRFPALSGLGRADHIALTFDDGPDPASTPRFLEVLAEHGVRATFFLLGSMLAASPQTGRSIAQAGHEIGVHGWEHRCLLTRGPRATHRDLQATVRLITASTGVVPVRYRPPYGVLTSAALWSARDLGLQPVLWTAWGRDWTMNATPGSVISTVTRDVRGGSTVLLHDSDCTSSPGSWHATLAALPVLFTRWHDNGWQTGPLRDHGAPQQPAAPATGTSTSTGTSGTKTDTRASSATVAGLSGSG